MIGDKTFRRFAGVSNHLGLLVEVAFGVDAEEVVAEDSFDHSDIAIGDRLGPLPFAFLYITFRLCGAWLLCRSRVNHSNPCQSDENQSFRLHILLWNFDIEPVRVCYPQ